MPAKPYLARVSRGGAERYATKAERYATKAERYATAAGTLCHRKKARTWRALG